MDAVRSSVEQLEALEIQGRGGPEQLCILMAQYLLLDELTKARLLYKRAAATLKDIREFHILFDLCKLLWQKQPITQFVTNQAWSPSIQPIMTKLIETFQEKTMVLLSQSYSVIKMDELARALGVSSEKALSFGIARNWTHNSDSNSLTRPEIKGTQGNEEKVQLQQLTEVVVHLEKSMRKP
eukprot:m.92689 g.92689  ORF g.92689 m.92689 type:complete len:182 (+) comp13360_c0_seq2:135-680(+)